MSLTVDNLVKEFKKDHFWVDVVSGSEGLSRKIKSNRLQRPGLALVGNFDYFQKNRPLVFGRTEIKYMKKMGKENRTKIISRIFSYPIPFMVITRMQAPIEEIVEYSNKRRIPLLITKTMTFNTIARFNKILDKVLSPFTTIQGVLMEIYGFGVLIMGESGIGKSECALELLNRGHRIITDDLVHIVKREDALIGSGKEPLSGFMELRGVGILEVGAIFGAGAVRKECKIDLVVRLEETDKMVEYERLGMGQKYTHILKVKVPELVIPVRPGRNLAVILEVASMNQRLHNKGYFPAKELDKKLVALMKKKK